MVTGPVKSLKNIITGPFKKLERHDNLGLLKLSLEDMIARPT